VKEYNMNLDLKWEDSRNAEFMRIFPLPLEKKGGKEFQEDFVIKSTNLLLELKSERYPSRKNIFIERYSNLDYRTDGGPWRSKKHGIQYYIHFMCDNKMYIYSPKDIVPFLESYISFNCPRAIELPNIGGWVTLGYPIPVKELKEFEIFFQ